MHSRPGSRIPSRERGFSAAKALVSVAAVLALSYTVERITEYCFLTGSPVFGDWSGPRIWLFMVLILAGSVAAGVILKSAVSAAVCSVTGVIGLTILFYVLCTPKVCYSTGPEELKPLRLGLDLSSTGVAGGSMGAIVSSKRSYSGLTFALVSFATFVADAYYPVVFTFAGTRLLASAKPWGSSPFSSSFHSRPLHRRRLRPVRSPASPSRSSPVR